MTKQFFRLISRTYMSLLTDFLVYVIVPSSIILAAIVLYPEEFEKRINSSAGMATKKLPTLGECVGKLGMENGDIRVAFVKIERVYWNINCASLSLSQKLIELGVHQKN